MFHWMKNIAASLSMIASMRGPAGKRQGTPKKRMVSTRTHGPGKDLCPRHTRRVRIKWVTDPSSLTRKIVNKKSRFYVWGG